MYQASTAYKSISVCGSNADIPTSVTIALNGSGTTMQYSSTTKTITKYLDQEKFKTEADYYVKEDSVYIVSFPFSDIKLTLTATSASGNKECYSTKGTVTLDKSKYQSFKRSSLTFIPEGALHGEFTVDESGKKVRFSQGNLYLTGESTWGFQTDQINTVGSGGANKQSSTTNTNVSFSDKQKSFDLFGWTAQGLPASVTEGSADTLKRYGVNKSLTSGDYADESHKTLRDWGTISSLPGNSGTTVWRTLTSKEWSFLLISREFETEKHGEGYSYQRATVSGVYGLIIYPDGYAKQLSSDDTTVNEDTWATMQSDGCVFLPAGGYRNNLKKDPTDPSSSTTYSSLVYDVNTKGYYWASAYGSYPYRLAFSSISSVNINQTEYYEAVYGYSVRLVSDVK